MDTFAAAQPISCALRVENRDGREVRGSRIFPDRYYPLRQLTHWLGAAILALFAVNHALPLKSIEGPPPPPAHSPHKPTAQ